ncbi:pyridoxamine 5-phosphate oxidase [Paracoccus aerodenitrificans]|uniref:pyridoxamine 5-phosphate oxidase n=1 Tax=Paracoccus aerodenitrificans TaxID=3017781 RepID=UPI0022F02B7C|nr:pyridoxamine 5-phosphate oxidase [Paracoccus aerodenitrificans]WBU62688.1 pyridoxamine 5-phosphate oxidase [Paracoccus aerodenitrificans]
MKNPVHNPDDEARALVRRLIADIRHVVLSVQDRQSGHPHLSRIAVQADADAVPVAFLSEIAHHTRLLHTEPRAGLLIEDLSDRGDAMARPRLTLRVIAEKLPQDSPDHEARIASWVAQNPKAKIYAALPDFFFWRMRPMGGLLNAGFGKAYVFSESDLRQP